MHSLREIQQMNATLANQLMVLKTEQAERIFQQSRQPALELRRAVLKSGEAIVRSW
jgi:hypothetical protein